MKSTEIQHNVQNVIDNFSKDEFVFDLLIAYGISKTSVTRLKKGDYNLSKVDGESPADFVHKMAIDQKEANETAYWLELLHQSDFLESSQYKSIILDIQELNKILESIIITSKEKKHGKR